MRGTHMRWLVPAIAVAALISAPLARSDESGGGGGHSSGGPAYGTTLTSGSTTSQAGSAGGHSSGGPGYGIAPAGGAQSTVFVQASDNFDGRDFALGAGVALSAALIAAITAAVLRSRRRLAHSH